MTEGESDGRPKIAAVKHLRKCHLGEGFSSAGRAVVGAKLRTQRILASQPLRTALEAQVLPVLVWPALSGALTLCRA